MRKATRSATTRIDEGGDNAVGENARLGDMGSDSDSDDADASSSRQGKEDEGGDEEEEEEGDDDESDDDEEEEGDESDDSDDDSDEEESDDADAEEDDEEGLDDLTHDEAIERLKEERAVSARQQKGVEKLKRRAEKLAEELEAANEKAASYEESHEKKANFEAMMDDPEGALVAIGDMIEYAARFHSKPMDEVVGAALKLAKTKTGKSGPDFVAQATEDAEDIEFDDDVDKERWIKTQAAVYKRNHEAVQSAAPKTESSRTGEQGPKKGDIEARFSAGFKEAVASFKEDYPDFKLTEQMAREAVKAHPGKSVEDACFRQFRKQMTESQVSKARKDAKNRNPRLVRSQGRQGRPKNLPKDQAKYSMDDLRRM